jgi:hypothetical protein
VSASFGCPTYRHISGTVRQCEGSLYSPVQGSFALSGPGAAVMDVPSARPTGAVHNGVKRAAGTGAYPVGHRGGAGPRALHMSVLPSRAIYPNSCNHLVGKAADPGHAVAATMRHVGAQVRLDRVELEPATVIPNVVVPPGLSDPL